MRIRPRWKNTGLLFEIYNYFIKYISTLVYFSSSSEWIAALCTQQASTAQCAECFPLMHISTVVQLCPLAGIFIAHRWEQECGWNYRYWSAPVNLCCHTVASCLPQVESNQRDSHCRGTAGTVCRWASLKQRLAESKRVTGKWGESCLKFDLYEEVSAGVFGKHRSDLSEMMKESDWLQSRLPFLIQPIICSELTHILFQNREAPWDELKGRSEKQD